jgi:hypothetical protein
MSTWSKAVDGRHFLMRLARAALQDLQVYKDGEVRTRLLVDVEVACQMLQVGDTDHGAITRWCDNVAARMRATKHT